MFTWINSEGGVGLMEKDEKELLHATYYELYQALDGNDALLMQIWEKMGGQQVNLPDHLYDRKAVESYLMDKAQQGPLDITAESKKYGYSRRWIREVERRAKRENNHDLKSNM